MTTLSLENLLDLETYLQVCIPENLTPNSSSVVSYYLPADAAADTSHHTFSRALSYSNPQQSIS